MTDFLGEEAMFDEQDRRLRLSREQDSFQQTSQAGRGASDTNVNAPAQTLNNGSPTPGTNGLSPAGGGSSGPNTNAPPPQSTSTFTSAHAEDSRPAVDGVPKGDLNTDDVKALEGQLQALGQSAQQLEQKAKKMEQRARELQ
jgi:hypothetical protein